MSALRRDAYYPLGDDLPELPARPDGVRARWTGEQRAPRAGEWYLSGAIIAAYRARADMTAVYPIAELVRGRSVTQWLPDELG
jgi:hypothetical protein